MATQYVTDQQGTFIAASQRPDGSWRKPRRVKEGFVPQEEVPLYESKAKKIAKEKADLLPAGITKQAWEKMKEEQKKLANPGANITSGGSGKKKGGDKKKKSHSVDHGQFEINEPVIGNESAFLPSGGGVTTVAAAVAGLTKSKLKDKLHPKTEGDKSAASKKSNNTLTAKNTATAVEEWVTMGKPKKGGAPVQQPAVQTKVTKSAPATKKSQPTGNNNNNNSAPTAPRRDPHTDMLLDSALDGENETNASATAGSANTEKQQLVKKIKKLKSKLKEAETLKQRSDAGENLDESQVSKAQKLGQFAKEMQTLQKQLQAFSL